MEASVENTVLTANVKALFDKIYKAVGLSKNEIAELNESYEMSKIPHFDLTMVAPMSKNGLIELSQLKNMGHI